MSLVCVTGVGPASATSATLHSSLGNVSATLSYQGTFPIVRHEAITITRSGHVVYRQAVSAAFCGTMCWPAPTYGSKNAGALRVVRLEAGSPDVVLGLFSGGAHCCFVAEVFAPSTATSYAKTEINLGDPGARLEVLPHSPYAALVSADDSFAYAFTDYAASGLPIKVLRFSGHGFTNVTRHYPALIRTDAKNWLSAFYSLSSTHYSDSVGVIAAWAADQYLLGRANAADQFLDQQAAAGHLNSLLNPSLKGVAFVTELEKFLQRQGY